MGHATEQDDKFEGEYIAARLSGDIDHVARLLSERLRQMDKRSREANKRADATEAENERLRQALTEIAERHIPDQPASAGGDELSWAQRQHGALRAVARAALVA